MTPPSSNVDRYECTCAGRPLPAVAHALNGIGRTILAFIIPGLIFAVLWGLIDWLRNFNAMPPVALALPFTSSIQQVTAAGQQMDEVERFVDTYNILFPGACRFGSGIGMVLGGFWSICHVRQSCLAEKLSLGLFAGSLLGARIMLMGTSKPQPLMFGAIFGATVLTLYLLNHRKLYPFPPLPSAPVDSRYLDIPGRG